MLFHEGVGHHLYPAKYDLIFFMEESQDEDIMLPPGRRHASLRMPALNTRRVHHRRGFQYVRPAGEYGAGRYLRFWCECSERRCTHGKSGTCSQVCVVMAVAAV
jgi:hypothetical protein